jgi:chromosome transmission fidelity protein 8
MLIPLTFPSSNGVYPKLPPTIAKVSHDEVVLIELQGVLEITGDEKDKEGQLVGMLTVDEGLVSPPSFPIPPQTCAECWMIGY